MLMPYGARTVVKNNINLKKDLMRGYVNDLNALLKKNVSKIKNGLYTQVFNAVYFSPEMESLRTGVLRLDFGLVSDPSMEISSAVARSIDINFDRFQYSNNSINGNLEIGIQPIDYLNLLNLPSSVTITEQGVNLPWLEWMLKYGDSVIIINYGVKYTSGGRTGGAVMSRSTRPFKVDPRFSGTDNENFITRAISRSSKEIEKKIWQIILN